MFSLITAPSASSSSQRTKNTRESDGPGGSVITAAAAPGPMSIPPTPRLSRNRGSQIAFFHRVELLSTAGGEEILPITYDDNYVSVFGGETVEISGRVPGGGPVPAWVRVTGYGGTPVVAAVR